MLLPLTDELGVVGNLQKGDRLESDAPTYPPPTVDYLLGCWPRKSRWGPILQRLQQSVKRAVADGVDNTGRLPKVENNALFLPALNKPDQDKPKGIGRRKGRSRAAADAALSIPRHARLVPRCELHAHTN